MVIYNHGFPAIASGATEVSVLPEDIMSKIFKYYKHVFVLMDTDLTGTKINQKYKNLYPNINTIQIPIRYKHKDISDFESKFGYRKTDLVLKKLIRNSLSLTHNQKIPF
jgi:5S rRNA maturation endonuclease (ribonuclease M5)